MSDPALVAAVRAAFDADDPLAAWYLDLGSPRVVGVRDGRTNVPDLRADEVERDETRFVEIPAVTTTQEYLWMEDFVAESGDPRLERLLDRKQGANRRFVKSLPQAGPDAAERWTAYRARRLAELVDEWLAQVLD